jgi:hypothetical protein
MRRVGQRFRLHKETIATVGQDGRGVFLHIPEGEEIVVLDPVPNFVDR